MKTPYFEDGSDTKTFAPFVLEDCGDVFDVDIRLTFGDWGFLLDVVGAEVIDGYYLNGYGLQGLLKAARFDAGIQTSNGRIEYNSEGDILLVLFTDMEDACTTAELAQAMCLDGRRIRALVAIARREGFEE